MTTELAARMTSRADRDGLAEDHDLRVKAKAFEDAAKGFYCTAQTVTVQQFMGCWARARRAWSEYSGEPLL